MSGLKPALGLPPLVDTKPVFCQDCEQWFTPDATWRCPCGELAAFGVQPGTCPVCQGPAQMVRNGNVVRSLCRCLMTGPERIALEQRHRELEREDREVADQLAGRRPKTSGKTTLPDQAPLEEWWPALCDLIPPHIDRGPILDHVQAHCEDFALAHVVESLRKVLERIKRQGTTVGSVVYITAGLSRELGH